MLHEISILIPRPANWRKAKPLQCWNALVWKWLHHDLPTIQSSHVKQRSQTGREAEQIQPLLPFLSLKKPKEITQVERVRNLHQPHYSRFFRPGKIQWYPEGGGQGARFCTVLQVKFPIPFAPGVIPRGEQCGAMQNLAHSPASRCHYGSLLPSAENEVSQQRSVSELVSNMFWFLSLICSKLNLLCKPFIDQSLWGCLVSHTYKLNILSAKRTSQDLGYINTICKSCRWQVPQ